jgi:hypothetical protein
MPNECSAFRNTISGAVSLLPILAIIAERSIGENKSGIQTTQLLHTIPNETIVLAG